MPTSISGQEDDPYIDNHFYLLRVDITDTEHNTPPYQYIDTANLLLC